MITPTTPPTRVALISMPWQDPFSPSIQLGTLKAWVEKNRPDVRVETFELFLELANAIGIHLAKRISVSWIGEALFAYLMFPSQAMQIAKYLEGARSSDPAFQEVDFGSIMERLQLGLRDRLDSVDWAKYHLVGVSVVFSQMMGSILVAHEIKRRAPDVPIVFGGPSCTGQIGQSLLRAFDSIDYVVNGEGERPFLGLINALQMSLPGQPIKVRGVVHRDSSEEEFQQIDQLPTMTELPEPNYEGYFRTIKEHGYSIETLGRIRLPIETSRGCWWDRSHVDPMLSCTFCNLNLQWNSYREKGIDQSVEEIRSLSNKYECPDFTIVDNILRIRDSDNFVSRLRDLGFGYDFWMEARASVDPEQIRSLREAGARVIQFGIESLSTSMLGKMVKGTTVLQNLQAMKFCEEYGIRNTANLIIDYPGIGKDEIIETIENIKFARGYRPLDIAEFSLVYQAPAYKSPLKFGIRNIRNYHMYQMLLPAELNDALFLTEKSFDCYELEELRTCWAEVRKAVEEWKEHYEEMQSKVEGQLLLSLQDGGRYLKIRDFREREPKFYWLKGKERDVYLECSKVISVLELSRRFPLLPDTQIREWIDEWKASRLLYEEKNKVLALAVPWGRVSSDRMSQPIRNAIKNSELKMVSV